MEHPPWLIYFFLTCLAFVAGLFIWSIGTIYSLFLELEESHDEH
ncbi:hypothetical protein [Vibrio bivalvicida]|uniref:Uncharacterized protein n=1 Tax=Vibrio bivalvicida TaxID=1276888 RepID=A0ABV4MLI4_9VIBR